MTHDEKLITIRAMNRYGGSFVKALSKAWICADDDNAKRIETAFPEYIEIYGPGSAFFIATEAIEP